MWVAVSLTAHGELLLLCLLFDVSALCGFVLLCVVSETKWVHVTNCSRLSVSCTADCCLNESVFVLCVICWVFEPFLNSIWAICMCVYERLFVIHQIVAYSRAAAVPDWSTRSKLKVDLILLVFYILSINQLLYDLNGVSDVSQACQLSWWLV